MAGKTKVCATFQGEKCIKFQAINNAFTYAVAFASPTFSGKEVPTDEGRVHVLQQDDALLRRHAEQVVEAVVGERAVAQAHQADTVAELARQRRAGTRVS